MLMKVAIYNGKNGISIEERPIPVINETEVLVRNLRAGICGTDITIVKEGTIDRGIRPGSEFGHEMVSEIVQVGSKVSSDIKVGMIVGINPITAKRTGRRESLQCGGFSQYMVVEDARLDYNLYLMNSQVALETSALMEPMSVGRHGAFQINPAKTDNIVVLGAGAIGLSAAASLIAENIMNVCVVDIHNWRLEKARELGAKTVNTAEINLKEGLSQLFGQVNVYGQPMPDVDVFIDAAGAPFLFEEVLKLVKHQARISVVAVYKNEVPISLAQVMSKELVIQGSSGYTSNDIKQVAGYINEQKTNIGTIVSKIYKLDQIEQAFETAIAAKDVIKVSIDLT